MIPVWPGRDERGVGSSASRAAATISNEAVILPTEQSVPTVRTTSASTSPASPLATERSSGGPAYVPEFDAVIGRQRGELLVVAYKVVEAGNDVAAGRDRRAHVLAPRLVEAAADRRDPDI